MRRAFRACRAVIYLPFNFLGKRKMRKIIKYHTFVSPQNGFDARLDNCVLTPLPENEPNFVHYLKNVIINNSREVEALWAGVLATRPHGMLLSFGARLKPFRKPNFKEDIQGRVIPSEGSPKMLSCKSEIKNIFTC